MKKILSYFAPIWNGKEKPEMWDIFNNYYAHDMCVKAVKRYLRAPNKYVHKSFSKSDTVGFEALCEEFDIIFMNQFWSRYEYELSIGEAFPIGDDGKPRRKLYKKDVYWFLKPNIPVIVRGCISQYKMQNKTAS